MLQTWSIKSATNENTVPPDGSWFENPAGRQRRPEGGWRGSDGVREAKSPNSPVSFFIWESLVLWELHWVCRGGAGKWLIAATYLLALFRDALAAAGGEGKPCLPKAEGGFSVTLNPMFSFCAAVQIPGAWLSVLVLLLLARTSPGCARVLGRLALQRPALKPGVSSCIASLYVGSVSQAGELG